MRILLGYSYYNYSVDIRQWNEAWLARLRAAGITVQGTCLTINPPNGRLGWKELDLRWRRRDRELLAFYERLAVQAQDFDVFVNYNGINLHPEFVPQMSTFNVYCCFDDPESSAELSQPVAAAYDLSMVGNIAELESYRRWGAKHVRFLPNGFRPDDFDPSLTRQQILEGRREVDLTLLCERQSPWRKARLDKLASAFPQGEYYGMGWPKGFLEEKQRVPLLQRTKIGINIHNSTGPINFRTFYLPANGVFQICDNKSHLGQVFELNKEVVGFETMDEAIDLTRYYLAHDQERRQIAAAGWERARRDYNEVASFNSIIKGVEEVLAVRTASASGISPAAPVVVAGPGRSKPDAVRADHSSCVPIPPQQTQKPPLGKIFLHADALYSPDQWYRRFQHLLEQRYRLPFVPIDLLGPDRLRTLAQAGEGDALLGRFGHIPKDLALIRPIYDQLWRVFRGRVFPNQPQYFYYDDKQRQAELFRAKGYPAPKTAWAKNGEDLESFLRQEGLTFPVVVKKAEGAGSSNVRLAAHAGEVSFPCLVQEYCGGNDRDWRINVIGDRVMGFERLVRDNDFRASGSGRIVYPKEFASELVQLAHRITRENGFGSMAYDFVRRAGQWVVVEMSYAYTDTAVRDCPFYYDMKAGRKLEKQGVYPEDFLLADFLREHYGIEPATGSVARHQIVTRGAGARAAGGPNPPSNAAVEKAPVSAATAPPEANRNKNPEPRGTNAAKTGTAHPQTVSGKAASLPRVLLIADVLNWIFERHARTLHALLGNEFDFTLGFQGKSFKEDDFDLIYPLEFNLIDAAKIRNPAKYVTGIRSHLSWQPLDFLRFTHSLARNFRAVHVVSKRLQHLFLPFLPEIKLLSHGVDTRFFTPKTRADQSSKGLRLGWAGNRLSASRKGFKELIEPLGKLPGVELVFCGYSDRNLSLEQMKDFYDSLDAYVCASDFEGNNNSLMEAASMQRAIITTDTGAVPEYLKNGESALIVERELPNFIHAVLQLRDRPDLRETLGRQARTAVVRAFDWRQMADGYRAMFREAIAGTRQSPAHLAPSTHEPDRSMNPTNPISADATAPAALVERAGSAGISAGTQPVPSATKRQPGWSFCIITNGKRPQKLAEEIASIRAQGIPAYEILVGGDVPPGLDGVTVVALPEAAAAGRLGEMRNRLVERSRFDHVIVADDDLLFQPGFYRGLLQFGEDYEVQCVRFLNADGTRYWDWATANGPRGHRLLEYHETDPYVYVTGGLCIMKAWVGERVHWDDQRGFYQSEDLDFSARLRAAGISIKFNAQSTVVHTDVRYTQVGAVIMTPATLRSLIVHKVSVAKLGDARELNKRLRALDPEAADALGRETLHVLAPRPDRPRVTLPVRWRGPIFNPSGYASEAINFLLPLIERVDQLGLLHYTNIYSQTFVDGLSPVERGLLYSLCRQYELIKGGIVIEHNPANGFTLVPDAAYRIGRTMFETDRIPPGWAAQCNQMDEVWVPSKFNVETFARSGVKRDKLRVMPEAVDENEFNPEKHEPLKLPHRAAYNFLAIFEWTQRKAWDVLLSAYFREFSAADDVCLYLRTYLCGRPDGDPSLTIQQLINEHVARLDLGDKALPRIQLIAEQVPQARLPGLYKAVDCLVGASRGEGWGRPQHEAMMMGLPVIATNWSGNTEFMTRENSYLVDYKLVDTPAQDPELRHYRGQRWAEPSESSLRQAMRRVQKNPAEARGRGKIARQDMLRRFSREAVTDLLVQRLQEIEQKLLTPASPAVTARTDAVPAAATKGQHIDVAWEGSFLDLGSLSHVNRELSRELALQPQVKLACIGSNVLPKDVVAMPTLQAMARRLQPQPPRRTQVTIRHAWPPDWRRPESGKLVVIQPWEFGALPEAWVKDAAHVDEFWVPSEYVRRVYVESGVPAGKVVVVPNGVDPDRFHPKVAPMKLATQKKFKFLFVGGTIFRKGPDLLLKAFLDNFSAADDVCLVIKDFGGESVYAGQTFAAQIRAAQARTNAPEILYLDQELPPETLPSLYAACDALVLPYRGEGFGLPVLEAMACGLPVIVTAGGATDDFVRDEFAWRIPAGRLNLGNDISGLKLVSPGWLLQPEVSALGRSLREAFGNPAETRRRGQLAAAHARRFHSWKNSAEIAAQRIRDLDQVGGLAVLDTRPQVPAKEPTPTRKAGITLPPAALVGNLGEAFELLKKKKLEPAWNAARAAITVRPFHPEAALLLAEIAHAAGDSVSARHCAQYARDLAPDWKPARQFLKGKLRGNTKPSWLVLPPAIAGHSKSNPRLTVCLIVKNEEQFLGRCLASIREIAAQIVVVDTGSTDRTVEIAKEAGAEVHGFPWTDDFSAARNEALKHATGDWVLSLDADEELLPQHRPTLLQEMQAASVMAYRLPILDEGHEKEGCGYVPRLFRNAPGLFFLGRVHEQIYSSIEARRQEWGLENRLGKSVLLHHGYRKEIVAGRDKVGRNLRLLEMAIEELPGEPNLLMNLGLELVRSGQLEAGLERYREAFQALSTLPPAQIVPELREVLLTQYSTQLMGAKRYAEITRLWDTPFAKSVVRTASQHFIVGLAFMELRQPVAAAEQLRQCLAKRGQQTLTPVNPDILKSAPQHCLALALAAQKENDAATAAFLAALAEEPESLPVRHDFARFRFERGEPVEALKLLHEIVTAKPGETRAWQFGGQIALSRPGFLEFARNWTAEALKHHPDDATLVFQRAEALLLSEETEAARPLWSGPAVPSSPRQLAALLICEAADGDWQRRFSPDQEPLVSQELVKWCQRLISYRANGLISQLDGNLEDFRALVPSFVKVWEAAAAVAGREAVAC